MNLKRVIFLRVAWMREYKGISGDIPNGAGSYVAKNHDGGEVVNFVSVNDKYYGYARMQDNRSLNINRLGANPNDDFIDDVTVIFFATDPTFRGQYVVGWYENARLFRKAQKLKSSERKNYPWYVCFTENQYGRLLKLKERKFLMPTEGLGRPGQTNVWYVLEYPKATTFLKDFLEFTKNPRAWGRKSNPNARGWQVDAEKRKATELAAMATTENYFLEKGFDVKYVHRQNLGWDLEAKKGNVEFKLEIKGTYNDLNSIELTPNEYYHSKRHVNFRVCILENALDNDNSKLHICHFDKVTGYWISDTGRNLKVKEVISAQLKLI